MSYKKTDTMKPDLTFIFHSLVSILYSFVSIFYSLVSIFYSLISIFYSFFIVAHAGTFLNKLVHFHAK